MTDDGLPADDYPIAWQPRERREMDQRRADRTTFEQQVSKLTDEDIRQIREANR